MFIAAWWFRFPIKIRRFSKLLSEAWFDGAYLTAWPKIAQFAPIFIVVFGLIEGASHWSLQTYAGGNVSSAIHAIDFVQMLPLLFIAVICGALSSQLGMLLVFGFAIGDFLIAGSPYGPLHWSTWDTISRLYAPQLISYLAFFLLAVTPALTAKAMVATLPSWLRRPGTWGALPAASLAIAIEGISIYSWTPGSSDDRAGSMAMGQAIAARIRYFVHAACRSMATVDGHRQPWRFDFGCRSRPEGSSTHRD